MATGKAGGPKSGDAPARKKRATNKKPAQTFTSDGPRVAQWLETYCLHTKGVFAGQPLRLEPWQRDYVDELFRLDPKTGKRVWTDSLLLLPRKNGKSTLAAGLALYMLTADGEQSPEVFLAANSREQAGAVFRQMKDMVVTSPGLLDWVTPMRSHLEARDNLGIARVLSADAKLQHGTNPSCSIVDELWAAKSMELLEALVSGVGARQAPLSLIISTVGHDKKSPLGSLHKRLFELDEKQIEVRNDGYLTIGRDYESGFLYWAFGPPLDPADWRYTCDLDDPDVWRQSNPASWITDDFLRKQRAKPNMRPSEFQRFMVNAWAENEQFWLPPNSWTDGREGYVPIEDGATITVGIDLGLKRDRSAVVICRRREVDDVFHFDVEARIFEPPADPDQAFDISIIRNHIAGLADRYDLERVAFDPWRLEETGQALEDDGLPMIRFSMGWERTGPASEGLYDAIVSGRVHHSGDPLFAAHVAAGATTENERGAWRLTKRKATEPIDALMALLMAHAESMAATGSGVNSIYEQRDLLVL